MTVFQGILLGLLQGIAEFLPISSSGHLAVAQHLFGLADVPLLFDVFLHLATLCSVCLYFRKVLGRLIAIFFRWIFRRPTPQNLPVTGKIATLAPNEHAGRNTIVMLIISTVITGLIGIFTKDFVEGLSIKYICAGFLFTAALLISSGIYSKVREVQLAAQTGVSGSRNQTGINFWQAIAIGFAQGIGTLPGVSRSGSTISGALFCGVDNATAGDYSFIVSIPAILGAFLLELKDLGQVSASIGAAPVIAGCAAAFMSGYIALTFLMKIIRRGRLEWFAAYLIPLGICGLIFF